MRLPYDYFYADIAMWNVATMDIACGRPRSFVKKDAAAQDVARALHATLLPYPAKQILRRSVIT